MPVAYIDLETFKGHSYPDVLISIIIKTLDSYSEWFSTAGVYPASKQSFWQKYFGAKPREKAIDSRKVDGLLKRVTEMRSELAHLLSEPEETTRIRKARQTKERGLDAKGSLDLFRVRLEGGGSQSAATEREIADNYSSKKIETLHRRIIDFKQIFSDLSAISGKQSYLFLDDLYHIRSDHQAEVVDYFHRITKGTNTWLKIGTIKHRTQWYFFGQPPIGMKLGDDADEIDLDVTLEKYDLTKEFLIKVLDQFCREHDSKVADILSDGARDRLVLASGGVARDFLSIVRRSINVTRQRLAGNDRFRGARISAEDVNKAAGELDGFKREDFNRDTTDDDSQKLNDLFEDVKKFCIDKVNCNCILVNKETKTGDANMIKELVDLKFLHHVRSRVTTRDRAGQIYDAYMLDISQYSGERKRRNLDMIEFWHKDGENQLRRSSLVFAGVRNRWQPACGFAR